MENNVLVTKILIIGFAGELITNGPLDFFSKVASIGFYGVGIFVLLSAHIDKGRKYKAWKDGGFKKEEKDQYNQ